MNNTILISLTNGVAAHTFCSHVEAHAALDAAVNSGSAGSLFTMEEETLSAEDVYSISPDLQRRVARAKLKLQDDWRIKITLDKHQVPEDRELRKSIYAALKELNVC